MVWKPHVTVAAVIERDKRFLLVEEQTAVGLQFNQPAGHYEQYEDLVAAVQREVFEETAWQFEPEYLVGIQLWRKNKRAPTFLRFCFAGFCHNHNPEQKLDEGIVATHWLSHAEIIEKQAQLRSPLVLTTIEQYLAGQRYPLSIIHAVLNHD